VPDEFEVYFQAEHLVDAGDISVPQTLAIREAGAPILFGKFGADGRPYAPYGPGIAYLIAPFHLAGRLLARARTCLASRSLKEPHGSSSSAA